MGEPGEKKDGLDVSTYEGMVRYDLTTSSTPSNHLTGEQRELCGVFPV